MFGCVIFFFFSDLQTSSWVISLSLSLSDLSQIITVWSFNYLCFALLISHDLYVLFYRIVFMIFDLWWISAIICEFNCISVCSCVDFVYLWMKMSYKLYINCVLCMVCEMRWMCGSVSFRFIVIVCFYRILFQVWLL